MRIIWYRDAKFQSEVFWKWPVAVKMTKRRSSNR